MYWVRVLIRVDSCSTETMQHRTVIGVKICVVCFDKAIAIKKASTWESLLGSSPGKDSFCGSERKK